MLSGILLIIFLLISAITDLKYKKIYMHFSMPFAIAGILLDIAGLNLSIEDSLFGMSLGFLLIGTAFITKEKIGMGDGIVFSVTGIYLGFFGNLFLLTISLFLCACFSVIALAAKKADRNSSIPMMPFLILPAVYEVIAMGAV